MEQIQNKRGRPGAEETGLVEKMVKLRIYADITHLDVSAHPKTALFSAKRFSVAFQTSSPRNAGGGRMQEVQSVEVALSPGRTDVESAGQAHQASRGQSPGHRSGVGGGVGPCDNGRICAGCLIAWFNVTNAATPAVANSGFQRPAKLDKGNPRRLSGLYKMYTEHKHSLYPAVGLLGGVYESTQSYFAGYRVIMGTKNATGQQGRGFTAENDRKSPDSHRRNRSARTTYPEPKMPRTVFSTNQKTLEKP
ncbi:hypothetical protein C8J57DRAFT_1674751 [Mycena rebaudengoi]|nr:hypothetical protein C8J57DRAFT_1674751 [Mycena rebaudengoi]